MSANNQVGCNAQERRRVAFQKKNQKEQFGNEVESQKINNMVKKSILIWLSIIPLAILNGGFREIVLTPRLGENCAQPISGIILIFLLFIVSFIFIPRIGKGLPKTYWEIGVLWVAMTIVFETILGLAMGDTVMELMKAYDFTTGNLWLFVVLFTGITPWLVAKIKKII